MERELVLRLAGLLWRLRRAAIIETGLFEIQADQLSGFRQARRIHSNSREIVYAMFGRSDPISSDQVPLSHRSTNCTEASPWSGLPGKMTLMRTSNRIAGLNSGRGAGATASFRRKEKARTVTIKPLLDPDGSGALRDQLLRDVDHLSSADAAATWAHRIMAAKNSLAAADARRVEDAFAAKVATLAESSEVSASDRVDKSLLALPEPRRFRDKTHVKFVSKQPCLICGRRPADAHHLRFAQHPALGRKVSDEFIVPLCRGHHREVHRSGDEASWWSKAGIDPIGAARTLWTENTRFGWLRKPPGPWSVDGSPSTDFERSIRSAAAHPKSQNNEAN